MQKIWDDRFDHGEYIYGKLPNAFFKHIIDTEKCGSLLLPAEGEGRNAIYALKKGWEVTAVDFSGSARDKAMSLAKEHNLVLTYKIADLRNWDENIEVDCIGLIYAHFPPEARNKIYNTLIGKLKMGGKLFLEGFSEKQLKYNSGGPKNKEWLYSKASLKKEFSNLDILYIEELNYNLDEGPYHRGEASLIRMVAQKK